MILKSKMKALLMRTQKATHRTQTYMRHLVPSGSVCPHRNIYHCSTQKTASQWIRHIIQNVYPYTALDELGFVIYGTRIPDIQIKDPFPAWTFVSQLYIDYATYQAMPKPASYRSFYVLRDPRDIVVSWYFSTRYSHKLVGDVKQRRTELSELDLVDGLIYVIHYLDDYGLFNAQRSWITNSDDPQTKIMRYEDLANDEIAFLRDLFSHCDMPISEDQIQSIAAEHGFKSQTGGREQGKEDVKHQYRKGIANDWPNHFDDKVIEEFKRITGDLVMVLGYESTADWTLP